MVAAMEKVCVTGAGGFLGSWVVKLLLSKDFIIHGTVREPSDEKNAHLKKLDKASENLKLFKAELLDYDSLYSAIEGCKGVFHVASPIPSASYPAANPQLEIVEPAVKGTINVLKACVEAKVKRVVYVSSLAAVEMVPTWPKGTVMDESFWSDKEHCRTTNVSMYSWYCLSKTEAESEALEFGKRNGLDVVSVCPAFILGPMLQPNVNASSLIFIKYLKDGLESAENGDKLIVDVRDVVEALVLAYQKPEAEGRYICSAHEIKVKDLVEKLRSIYPNYHYPKSFTEVAENLKVTSAKLQKLGWRYRPLEETLVDSVESYRNAGVLD